MTNRTGHNIDAEFEKQFMELYPRLVNFAIRFTEDKEAAMDIVQDSFVRLWEKRNKIKIDAFKPFIYAIVRNACLDYVKHRGVVSTYQMQYVYKYGKSEQLYNFDFDYSPETTLICAEIQEIIQKIIDSLPPRCKQVFIMSRLEGKTNVEIAKNLGISTTAVEKHIARAIKQFRTNNDKMSFDIHVVILAWLLASI